MTLPSVEPSEFAWDVFISHASEDKDEVARPLAHLLQEAGLRVWFDEQELKLGDSLNEGISNGLRRSRFGLVVLSPHFIKRKKWTAYEINALFSLESVDQRRILPITHNLQQHEVTAFNPTLADRVSVSTAKGLPAVSRAVVALFSPAVPAPTDPQHLLGASRRVSDIARDLELLLKQLDAVGIHANLQLTVLNEYRYSHRHLLDAAVSGDTASLEKSEQHLVRAMGDVLDLLVLHLTARLNDLQSVEGSMSAEDRQTLDIGRRRLASYVESLVAIRAGRERLSGQKIAATAGEVGQVLKLLENLPSTKPTTQLKERLIEIAIETARRIIGYL